MEATLFCSTGLQLRADGHSVLVDALNGTIHSFKEVSAADAQRIIGGEDTFYYVDALLYTHLHPDHYEQQKNTLFLQNHPESATFFPTEQTPDHGIFQAGPFTIEYFYVEHMPCDYTWAKHYCLLVSYKETSVYFTADADVGAEHRKALAGRRVTAAFWNPLYLSYPHTRKLMGEVAEHSFIYHVPEAATDQSGICRKLARNRERYAAELPNVRVLDRYPMELTF